MENSVVKQQVNMIFSPQEIEVLKQFEEFKVRANVIIKEKTDILKEFFRINGIDRFENDDLKIVYVKPTKRKQIDTDALKQQGLYESYLKEVEVSDSIRISCKYE